MKANCSFFWNRAMNQMMSAATVLAIVLAGAPGAAFAQFKSASPQKAAAVAAPTPEAARAKKAARPVGGQQEGIKVHGDWTIEVRNSDGTLAQRREFKNALVAQGATALANVLGRQKSLSNWSVTLSDVSGLGPCVSGGSGGAVACAILESVLGNLGDPTRFFPNLSVAVPTSGPNSGKLVLSGSATASNTQPSSIADVSTWIELCPNTTQPGSNCSFLGLTSNFTQHILQTPLTIAPGQIIQVTVVFSFS